MSATVSSACAPQFRGELEEAERVLLETCEARERRLGFEHADTQASIAALEAVVQAGSARVDSRARGE